MVEQTPNLVRLFGVLKTIVDIGPAITADRDFTETAADVLEKTLHALDAEQGALFVFDSTCTRLTCVSNQGFDSVGVRTQIQITHRSAQRWSQLQEATPTQREVVEELFGGQTGFGPFLAGLKCVQPLRMGPAMVGALCLGQHNGHGNYGEVEQEAMGMLAGHLAMLLQNHTLVLSLRNQISDNLRLLSSLDHSFDDALDAFATTIDAKDKHMRGHSMRVGRYAAAIGASMGYSEAEIPSLRASGQLHDIGKVTVDKSISCKPSALRPDEFREIADHTVIGHQIVSSVRFPWPQVPEVVRWHHERTDGSGYPDSLHGEEIPMTARIVAVADTFDAMTSDRPYRKGQTALQTAEELVRLAPAKFDPSVVQGLLVQLRGNFQGKGMIAGTPLADQSRIAATELERMSAVLVGKMTNYRVYSA